LEMLASHARAGGLEAMGLCEPRASPHVLSQQQQQDGTEFDHLSQNKEGGTESMTIDDQLHASSISNLKRAHEVIVADLRAHETSKHEHASQTRKSEQEKDKALLQALQDEIDSKEKALSFTAPGMNSGRGRLLITRADLEAHFDVPIVLAASRMGVGLSYLKKICREHGIARWPARCAMPFFPFLTPPASHSLTPTSPCCFLPIFVKAKSPRSGSRRKRFRPRRRRMKVDT
jgi:hypothetical protein